MQTNLLVNLTIDLLCQNRNVCLYKSEGPVCINQNYLTVLSYLFNQTLNY
jgi:hypothetical protein